MSAILLGHEDASRPAERPVRLLITGAQGFIGGSVATLACSLGHEVLGLTRRAPPTPATPYRLEAVEGERALSDACDGFAPDAVIHAAGTASVGASITSPRDDFAGSVGSWLELLEAVRRSASRPAVLLLSSAAVYGNPTSLPVAEDATTRPISPYGFHKLAAELLAEEYASCFGLEIIAARLFSVFGPTQRRLLLWELFEQMTGPSEAVTIQGTGRETRDFLHVDDVALALVEILSRRAPPTGHVEIVNVASGGEISVMEIAELIRSLVSSDKPIVCRGLERPGDPKRWCADTARLTTRLSPWRPRDARASLPECIDRWRRHEVARA